jgi:predicted acyltransferase
MNAIGIYMTSELVAETLGMIRVGGGSLQRWIYHNAYASWASPANASLLYALSYVLLMFGIAYGMYRKRWFLKV